jgi:hypothetical protein
MSRCWLRLTARSESFTCQIRRSGCLVSEDWWSFCSKSAWHSLFCRVSLFEIDCCYIVALFALTKPICISFWHTPNHRNKPTCISLLNYGLNRKCKCGVHLHWHPI